MKLRLLRDADQVLTRSAALEDLYHKASSAAGSPSATKPSPNAIVAGRGLDLSGHLDCGHADCRRRQVDTLFSKAWHYFDQIVVADAVSHEVSFHWDVPAEQRREWILPHIDVLLYLRSIGAEDLVEFREKPPPCQEHLEVHARDAGIEGALLAGEAVIPELLAEADIELRNQPDGSVSWRFDHSDFEHTQWGSLSEEAVSGKSDNDMRQAACRTVLKWFIANLCSDVAAAKHCSVPLGSVIWLHRKLLSATHSDLTPSTVAFELQLPVLQGVPTATLINIRQNEQEHFQRFRDSLRLAISERLKSMSSSAEAAQVADEIRVDIIEPELRRIRDRLAAAESVLRKKAASGLALGALITTIGLLGGVEAAPLVGVGATAAVSINPLHRYIDAQAEIELSDLYFLWRAVAHVGHEV